MEVELEAELLYLYLGDVAHHVADLIECNQLDELPALATALERLQVEGDRYVQEATIIGFLEGLQSVAGHRRVSTQALERAFGPETRRSWAGLTSFWSGQIPLAGSDLGRRSR